MFCHAEDESVIFACLDEASGALVIFAIDFEIHSLFFVDFGKRFSFMPIFLLRLVSSASSPTSLVYPLEVMSRAKELD